MLDSAELIRVTWKEDDSGSQPPEIVSRNEVPCEVQSVGMKESYQAYSVGRNPEVKLVLADFADYAAEQYALYDSAVFKILRTYRAGRRLELTLERTRDLEGVV